MRQKEKTVSSNNHHPQQIFSMSGMDFQRFREKADRDYWKACEELNNDSSLSKWEREAALEKLRKRHSREVEAAYTDYLSAEEEYRKSGKRMADASESTARKKTRPGSLDPDLFYTDPWVDDPDAYLLDDEDEEDD